MSTFLFVYRYPRDGQAGGPEVAAAWQRFLDGLGSGLVDAGNPAFAQGSRGNCPPAETVLGGYSMIAATDLEAALRLTEGCPALEAGGCVEVGELTLLNMQTVHTTARDHARATQPAD
jgi:hypothetical protein